MHGLGVDQILEFNIVTPDLQFLTASPDENEDLFWAVRGGGGSTFGVVTSMVVRAHQDATTTSAVIEWGVTENNITADTFWLGVAAYHARFPEWTAAGTTSHWNLMPTGAFPDGLPPGAAPPDGQPLFSVTPFMAPDKTAAELQALLAPWLAEMASLGIAVNITYTQFGSYVEALAASFPHGPDTLANAHYNYGSRLLPRASSDRGHAGGLNATMAALRYLSETGHMFDAYHLAPSLDAARPVAPLAVLPAWRDALSHLLVFASWPPETTAAEQRAIRDRFTGHYMQVLRDATPGSGSYMNEADREEPDFQAAFYGASYARLLATKRAYDPDDVFWAATAVGSEGWAVRTADGLPTENGRLCRVQ